MTGDTTGHATGHGEEHGPVNGMNNCKPICQSTIYLPLTGSSLALLRLPNGRFVPRMCHLISAAIPEYDV